MKVLVTGATGFIGGNLVRALEEHGYHVRALGRPHSSTLTLQNTKVKKSLGDIRDRESVAPALPNCEAIFHCATPYTFWSRHPEEIHRVNVGGDSPIESGTVVPGLRPSIWKNDQGI